jgi:hypothetical protein
MSGVRFHAPIPITLSTEIDGQKFEVSFSFSRTEAIPDMAQALGLVLREKVDTAFVSGYGRQRDGSEDV